MLSKNEEFEKNIDEKDGRVEEMEKLEIEIMEDKNYDNEGIKKSLKEVCERRERMKESEMERRKRLKE